MKSFLITNEKKENRIKMDEELNFISGEKEGNYLKKENGFLSRNFFLRGC
ncbi:MAG: hypothetical protein ACRC6A_11755 [Fusobacteriaceae bacterium]